MAKSASQAIDMKRSFSPTAVCSLKLSIYLLPTCVILFILSHIQYLNTPPLFTSPSPLAWSTFIHPYFPHRLLINPNLTSVYNHNSTSRDDRDQLQAVLEKLRQSIVFLPLKDLRYKRTAMQGHTWFMSSMYDTHEEGEVQYQQFPSESSQGRLLCLKGRETHDGSWNYYALAWPEALPYNATVMEGLTFVSYNHYDYNNIWHGLSSMVPFVAWHKKNGCEVPKRWILYHWGELRSGMSVWLKTLLEATFGGPPNVEMLDRFGDDEPVCFEKAVVMRHNEGGMSRLRRMEAFDLMRYKSRLYCNVSLERRLPLIGITLFMRVGPRSYKNETAVVKILERECAKVDGCKLMVAYPHNITFCEQVRLMSMTDVLASPHGAQTTNMIMMDRNSSVMEFFPKGWLKLAGIGQFVHRWLASWSGMRHEGTWRDPDGESCPFPEDDRRCMSIFKNGRIGFNETFLAEWERKILGEVKARKMDEGPNRKFSSLFTSGC